MEQQIIKERLLEYRPKTSLTFISKGRVIKVAFTDIVRISKKRSVTIIWTSECKVEAFSSLDELMQELPVNDFFQVHGSHIVCLHHVYRIFEMKIQVDNAFILFSDDCRKLMKDQLKMLLDNCCVFYDSLNS